MFGLGHVVDRDLVRPPGAFDRHAIDFLGASPSLGRAHDDHRPLWTRRPFLLAGRTLDLFDLVENEIEHRRHPLVHVHRVIAADDVRHVAVALEQPAQLALRDARQDRGVGDLPAVQMQNGQHGAVGDRVEELVRMPARRKRASLRLAVADHAEDLQVGVVEGGAVGMRERVPQLAALVDRSGRLRRVVTRDPTRE